ncbi:hypothetical protein APSETT445_008087 [Aspergillus pseudonomiae]
MAAASSQRPTNGGSIPPQSVPLNGVPRAPSHRRQQSHGMTPNALDYETDSDQTYGSIDVPQTRSKPYKNNPAVAHGHQTSRSFSARTKGLSREGHPNWREKPLPPEPYISPDEYATSRGSMTESRLSMSSSVKRDDSHMAPPPGDSHQTPLSRSNTVRSTAEQKHDWAADRSPLQKLEVALTGISKEEKRARVLEAEMRAKERIARQEAENNSRTAVPVQSNQDNVPRDTSSPLTEVSQRTDPEQPALPRQRPAQGPSDRAKPPHARTASVQHPVPLPANVPQSARGYPQNTGVVRTGNAPRRSVSVSHSAGNDVMGSQSIKLNMPRGVSGPYTADTSQDHRYPDPTAGKTQYLSPAASGARPVPQAIRRKEPPTATIGPQQADLKAYPTGTGSTDNAMPAHSDSSRQPGGNAAMTSQSFESEPASQPKPKRQTVSFDVPPPTPPPLSEWKTAPVARLGASDFDYQNFDVDKSKAWWEGGGSNNRRKSRALPINYQKPPNTKPSGRSCPLICSPKITDSRN